MNESSSAESGGIKQEVLAKKTIVEAVRLSAKFISDGGHGSSPVSPLNQWHALRYLENLHSEYDQGSNLALMKAIRTCAYHGLIMPQWVSANFILVIDRVLAYESKSWDDVLRSPFPKNTNINSLKKKERLKFEVFAEARNILDNNHNQPIDAGLFEKAAEKFGIGKTQAEEYCREVERITGGTLKQYKKIIIDLKHGKSLPAFKVEIS